MRVFCRAAHVFLCFFWEKGWWKDVGITSWKWVDMFSKRCEIIILVLWSYPKNPDPSGYFEDPKNTPAIRVQTSLLESPSPADSYSVMFRICFLLFLTGVSVERVCYFWTSELISPTKTWKGCACSLTRKDRIIIFQFLHFNPYFPTGPDLLFLSRKGSNCQVFFQWSWFFKQIETMG